MNGMQITTKLVQKLANIYPQWLGWQVTPHAATSIYGCLCVASNAAVEIHSFFPTIQNY
jgi:hypothetical protein